MSQTFADADSTLKQAVLAELAWDPSVSAAHLGVTVSSSIATLTGHVDSFAQKHAAEIAAARVKGVEAVVVSIAVNLPFEAQRSDGDIAAAVVNRLDWDASVPPNRVSVRVEDGWVTLTGEVDWQFQRNAAAQDVNRLHGVVGVSNQIAIKTSIDVALVREGIVHALGRSWSDPHNIDISTDGGLIRLTGTVRTRRDRDLAVECAWAASGATAVENAITISL